jgi:hypothetical protein
VSHVIEAPWLVNSGHGASLRHHNVEGGEPEGARGRAAGRHSVRRNERSFVSQRGKTEPRHTGWTEVADTGASVRGSRARAAQHGGEEANETGELRYADRGHTGRGGAGGAWHRTTARDERGGPARKHAGRPPLERLLEAGQALQQRLERCGAVEAAAEHGAEVEARGETVAHREATRVRCVSTFLDKNRRYIGKSQPKRPPEGRNGRRTCSRRRSPGRTACGGRGRRR